MDQRSALYLRAINVFDEDNIQLQNERLVFDGLYFHLKPGIHFNHQIETFDGPKESMIRIDEIGFRNQYGTYSNNPHIPYIFLGDSGTFGAGYTKPFPDIFSEIVGEQTLNLSIGGHGPQMYLNSLKEFGIDKSPKYIFITLFLNDMQNANAFDLLLKSGRDHQDYYLLYASGLTFPWPTNLVALSILQYCNTCIYLDTIISLAYSTYQVTSSSANHQNYSLMLDSGQTEVTLTEALDPPQSMCTNPCREYSINALRQVVELAESTSSRIVLTYLPHPSEIYYPYIEQNREIFYETHQPFSDNFGWAQELYDIADELGVDFADPRNFFIDAASQTPFLYRNINDPHLSARGHELFAKFLHLYITTND